PDADPQVLDAEVGDDGPEGDDRQVAQGGLARIGADRVQGGASPQVADGSLGAIVLGAAEGEGGVEVQAVPPLEGQPGGVEVEGGGVAGGGMAMLPTEACGREPAGPGVGGDEAGGENDGQTLHTSFSKV